MKRLAMLLPAVLVLAAAVVDPATLRAQSSASAEKTLAPYRDKNRVLLVFAPTAQDAAFREQNKLWADEKPGFKDRQLVVLPLLADAKPDAAPAGIDPATVAILAKKYGQDAKTFGVVLLGKDGHDAYRSAKPLKAETLYGVIDAMPMRRAEMKQPRPASSSSPAAPAPSPRKPDVDHDE